MFGNDPKASTIKDWTCVFETGQDYEAEMMLNFLSDRNINAEILSKKDRAYSVTHSQLSMVYVYVPDAQADAAREAIKEFEQGEVLPGDFPEGDEPDDAES